MNWKEKVAIGSGVGVGTFLLGAKSIENRMMPSEPADVGLGNESIEIHIMTLNEEGFIGSTLVDLNNQYYYRNNSNVNTVVADSNSTDNTVGEARKLADEIWTVPRGKLNARDRALRKSDADIIVATDADVSFSEYWLDHLLKPFEEKGVVGSHGPRFSKSWFYGPWRAWYNVLRKWRDRPFSGSNSAFRRDAYFECGGFDLSVNQYDRGGELNVEEEHRFEEKLETVGEVVWVERAPVFVSERAMPITVEDGNVDKYNKERKSGLRF